MLIELDGAHPSPEQLKALALYNYGHFTSMRVEGGRVRGLALHLQRLAADCRTLFDAALDLEWVRHLVRHALRDIDPPAIVRVTVFDPELNLSNPGAAARPHVLVTLRPASDVRGLTPLRVRSATYQRECPQVKHVGLFSTLRLRRLAQRDGFDDALLVEPDSRICEGTTWNIGFIRDDQVVWPEAQALPGVTRALLRRAHDRARTRAVILADLPDMAAAFATNAATGLRAIDAIDSARFPDGHPMFAELCAAYAQVPLEPL
jgi:branched-subunit amino acid aminotransferase/4-amino-4-deoxychorismate lyase